MPIREIVAGLLVLAAVLCSVRGTRRLARGLRQAVPLVLGTIFLAEELYESGLVAGIIRSAAQDQSNSS